MFISVTYSAARWLSRYPGVPVKIVEFDALIENPADTLNEVADFLEEGDWTGAHKCIEPGLRRSKPAEHNNDMWEDAEALYNMMLRKDYKGILGYMENKAENTKKQCSQIYCTRLGGYMTYEECTECHSSEDFVRNKIQQAEQDNIDWQTEPCLFECGYDVSTEEHITIEDSIADNHWLTVYRNSATSRTEDKEELTITDLYEDIYR